jgi:hypothetical protein
MLENCFTIAFKNKGAHSVVFTPAEYLEFGRLFVLSDAPEWLIGFFLHYKCEFLRDLLSIVIEKALI